MQQTETTHFDGLVHFEAAGAGRRFDSVEAASSSLEFALTVDGPSVVDNTLVVSPRCFLGYQLVELVWLSDLD